MPSIGFGEILVILVFALVIFGPRRLPEIGRTIGKSMRDFRRAGAEIRAELELDAEPPVVPNPNRVERKLDEREPPPGPQDERAPEGGGSS